MPLCALALIAFLSLNLHAADAPKFLGAQSCATSGCHGGADDKSRQYTVWTKYDVHYQRPFATLTTARSERIAATLKLGNPTQAARCTVCHAPMQTVPAERFAGWGESPREPGTEGKSLSKEGSSVASPHQVKAAEISKGVSCENCHGPAENWIRSHTRKDYTHADRVNAGMRDLKNLYVRANTCVACHQNVDADILAAGHPELIFELDGQCVTMPRHWQEGTNYDGAKEWLVGQMVALREMSWQLAKEKAPTERQSDRWAALLWVTWMDGKHEAKDFLLTPQNLERVQTECDRYTRQIGEVKPWTWGFDAPRCVRQLAASNTAFRDTSVPQPLHARRAERLVLALDRLTLALPDAKAAEALRAPLKKLFADVQSLPDFNPTTFANHLAEFQKALPKE